MQPEQIMSSDLLDILFADRNKMYGAYSLRREYSLRLCKALLITAALVCGALAFYYYKGIPEPGIIKTVIFDGGTIIDPVPEKPAPPPPAPQPKPRQQVATVQYATPVIVQNTTPTVPPIDDLLKSQVGTENKAGIPAEGFPPPATTATGSPATSAAPLADPDNSIREKVDVESTYPGGLKAWKRFLIKTFRYPLEAQEKEIFGTVLIRFVVDKSGDVSDIQALSGPEELRAEAIRVISKSGKWIPAMKSDSLVNSYKYQQILFQLSE